MRKITITLSDADATAFIALLVEHGPLPPMSVEAVANGEAKHSRTRHQRGDKRSLRAIVAAAFPRVGMTFTYRGISKMIEDHGFSPTSASPLTSNLVRDGYLEKFGSKGIDLAFKVIKELPSR